MRRFAYLRTTAIAQFFLCAIGLLLAIARPAFSQTEVALQLVLAVDASGSVDNRRFELQKQGYAAAFRNPQVLRSIQSLMTGSIAVTMMQWTGPQLIEHSACRVAEDAAVFAIRSAGACGRSPRHERELNTDLGARKGGPCDGEQQADRAKGRIARSAVVRKWANRLMQLLLSQLSNRTAGRLNPEESFHWI